MIEIGELYEATSTDNLRLRVYGRRLKQQFVNAHVSWREKARVEMSAYYSSLVFDCCTNKLHVYFYVTDINKHCIVDDFSYLSRDEDRKISSLKHGKIR